MEKLALPLGEFFLHPAVLICLWPLSSFLHCLRWAFERASVHIIATLMACDLVIADTKWHEFCLDGRLTSHGTPASEQLGTIEFGADGSLAMHRSMDLTSSVLFIGH